MKKNYFWSVLAIMMVTIVGFTAAACGSDDDENDDNIITSSIVGTWVDGSKTMVLGNDGSYYLTNTSIPDMPQYRTGTYSYNSSLGLMTVDIVAVSGQNGAYQQTYIVQTLTSSTLILLYEDGDVEGYYTHK